MSMIDISAELAGERETVATGRRCKFGRLLDAVPADQAAELATRLAGTGWSSARLAKLIGGTAFGHVAASTLNAHRRGDCHCDTPSESVAA